MRSLGMNPDQKCATKVCQDAKDMLDAVDENSEYPKLHWRLGQLICNWLIYPLTYSSMTGLIASWELIRKLMG